jgi:lysophospholipase L1-like esterase
VHATIRTGLVLILLFAGCGGDAEEPRLGGARTTAGATLVAALGDSITAGSPAWDPSEEVRRQSGASDPQSQYEYWAERRLRGVRFRNCGVFGERTDEIAARLDRCARGAKVLIVQGGINDIAQGKGIEGAARNLRAMAERGRRLGLRVALVQVLPWNNGYPRADPLIRALNRRITAIGKDLAVPVYPWYDRLEAPDERGRMRADWTGDGDHPNVEGYRRLAADVRLPRR